MPVYKGWGAKLFIPGIGTEAIGKAESVTAEIALGTESYYELGSAKPAEIVAGNIEITATITRAWIDTKLLQLITGAPVLSEFDVKVTIEGTTNELTLTGCKGETVSFDIPQDGYLTHDLDIRAKDFSITGPT